MIDKLDISGLSYPEATAAVIAATKVDEYSTEEERVNAGLMLLDAKCPTWANRIDVEWFDIGRADQCVWGQLAGDYDAGVDKVTGTRPDDGAWERDQAERQMQTLGFNTIGPGSAYAEADRLQELWVSAIVERQMGNQQQEGVDA